MKTGGFVVGGDGVAQDYDSWCATEFGPQIGAQAYSAEEPPEPERHTWPTALRRAGYVLAGAGLAVAAVVAIAGASSAPSTPDTAPSAAPAPTPPPSTPEAPMAQPAPFTMPPVPDAAHITQDGAYLHAVQQAGLVITDAAEAVAFAHQTCTYLARPDAGIRTYAMVVWTQNPGFTFEAILKESEIARSVYCPHE